MYKKFSNMDFSMISQDDLIKMAHNKANGCTWATYVFLKQNINTKTGILKGKVKGEPINYKTIANRIGYHHTNVRESVKWLNAKGLLNTYVHKELHGFVIGVIQEKQVA